MAVRTFTAVLYKEDDVYVAACPEVGTISQGATIEEAITKVQQLPAAEQDAIAQLILDELADEQQWDQAFARSQDALSQLATKVRDDIRAGKTKPLGMDDR